MGDSNNMIDSRFGIMKLEGETVIFSAVPNGLMRFWMISTALTVVGILLLPFVWIFGRIAQDKYRYWLTNRRIILSSGFIGYQIRSIPLERISDVGLSRSLPEILSGISSIVVRDMTGETDHGKSLLAIDDAPELQRQILEEVQRVNAKRDKI